MQSTDMQMCGLLKMCGLVPRVRVRAKASATSCVSGWPTANRRFLGSVWSSPRDITKIWLGIDRTLGPFKLPSRLHTLIAQLIARKSLLSHTQRIRFIHHSHGVRTIGNLCPHSHHEHASITTLRPPCLPPNLPRPIHPPITSDSKTTRLSSVISSLKASDQHNLDPSLPNHSLQAPTIKKPNITNHDITTEKSRRANTGHESTELGEEAVRWMQERKKEGWEVCVYHLLEEPEA